MYRRRLLANTQITATLNLNNFIKLNLLLNKIVQLYNFYHQCLGGTLLLLYDWAAKKPKLVLRPIWGVWMVVESFYLFLSQDLPHNDGVVEGALSW